jgi:hypothetical protein
MRHVPEAQPEIVKLLQRYFVINFELTRWDTNANA